MNKFNVKKIRSEIKKLNIPKEYFRIDLESFFNHDYTILLSIRQDAGKTSKKISRIFTTSSSNMDISRKYSARIMM